jgi:hypothetical protein
LGVPQPLEGDVGDPPDVGQASSEVNDGVAVDGGSELIE